VKHVADEVDQVVAAPESGIWRLAPNGELEYARFDYHRRAVETEDEGFWLRITGEGDYRYEGADLGILVTRGRLMTDDFRLNERARAFIRGLGARYRGRPLGAPEAEQMAATIDAGAFKIL